MPYFQEGNDNMRALEAMIDATSVATVLAAIASICHAKAEHIRSNWQDRVTAAPWNRAGNKVERAADACSREW